MPGLPFVILAAMLVIALVIASRVRATRVPMQWDFKGEPTWYAPRLVAFPVIVGLFVLGIVAIALPADAPHWAKVLAVGGVFFGQLLHAWLLFRWQKRGRAY
jgi:hypothetical protein